MWYVFPTNMQDSNPLYNLIILFQLSEKNHNSFLLYIAYIGFKSHPHVRAKNEHDLIFQRIARNHGSLARLILTGLPSEFIAWPPQSLMARNARNFQF